MRPLALATKFRGASGPPLHGPGTVSVTAFEELSPAAFAAMMLNV